MYKFSQLMVGDMFNTKAARWVKYSGNKALCVMSSVVVVGSLRKFSDKEDIVVLYSSLLNTDLYKYLAASQEESFYRLRLLRNIWEECTRGQIAESLPVNPLSIDSIKQIDRLFQNTDKLY